MAAQEITITGLEHHDDRSHYGEEVDIALELEGADYDETAAVHHLATIRTYLRQHYRETEPRVHLARGDSVGVQLTLAEAALLHDRLSELLDVAGYEYEG